MTKIGGIYLIINIINDKIYVGSAVYFNRRFAQHKHELNNNKHSNTYLQAAWNKYGRENFIFVSLIDIDDTTKLLEQETRWIKLLNSCDRLLGYNLREIPNSNLGFKFSDEFKAKISKSHLGIKRTPFTEETKRRMSEAQQNRKPISEETRAKMSLNRKGIFHSKETKEKFSLIRTGRAIHTNESKLKISMKNKGSKRTEESKEKMRIAKLGRKLSEETKAKMRESQRKRYNKT